MMNIRILIVDDQIDFRNILKAAVRTVSDDFDIILARDGFEALDALQEKSFDIVITDYVMPQMDGLELVEAIRSFSPETQIILTSALKHRALNALIAEANIKYFLPKPFSQNDINLLLQKVLATIDATRHQQNIESSM